MPDLGVILGERLNTDKKGLDGSGRIFPMGLRGFLEMHGLPGSGLSRLLVRPICCGENQSSGFVVSCGALWWIPGFVGIVAGFQGFLPRFAERIFA